MGSETWSLTSEQDEDEDEVNFQRQLDLSSSADFPPLFGAYPITTTKHKKKSKQPPSSSHGGNIKGSSSCCCFHRIGKATVFASTCIMPHPPARPPPRPEELTPATKASLDYARKDIWLPAGHEVWKATSPPDINDPIQLEIQLKVLSELARTALKFYKDTQGEEYELVEIKDNEAAILPPYIIDHLTFMAKPKYLSDGCPKLFFAEVYKRFYHAGGYEVKMCMTLDPFGPDVMNGCGYVQGDKLMLHPKGVKFWAGPPSGTPEWDEEDGLGLSSHGARTLNGMDGKFVKDA